MGREAVITQEEVNAVAERLQASGIRPTARGVREALGRGSMATVLKFLQAWQDRQAQPPTTPANLPAGVQRAILEFVAEELTARTSALEGELAALRIVNSDLVAESERQRLTIESQARDIKCLEDEKAEITGRLAQLTANLADAKEEIRTQRTAVEQSRTEQVRLSLQVESMRRLDAEIERVRQALESERSARAQAEQEAAVALAKLEKTEAQVAELAARLSRTESKLDALQIR